MTREEAIQKLKEAFKNAPNKLEYEKNIQDRLQLLVWLDYERLKADYIELDKQLRTANTEIDRLQSVSSWIPCSERMPEKDGNYLCISNNEYKILPYRNGEFYFVCFDSVLRCCNSSVTHWMPLPAMPEVTANSFSASSMSGGSA